MKKFIAAIVLAVVMFVTPMAPASAHHSNDTRDCVTHNEYEDVNVGDHTRAKVHEIFDFNGSQVWQNDGREKRHYRACEDGYDFYVWYWYGFNGRDAWVVNQKATCYGC